MRRDTDNLVHQAIGEKRKAYVLVNNRSEGNAPLTVQALVERLHTEAGERIGRLRTINLSPDAWQECGRRIPG